MKIDIIFIDGLESKQNNNTALGYLYSIAALLEKKLYSFKILNITTLPDYSLNGLISELKHHDFKSIAMTTNADNIRNVYKICNALKNEFIDIPIILGGPQVTFTDEKTILECKCDIIIRNDGENSLIEVLDYINGKVENLNKISGITFINNGHIYKNADSISVNYLDLPTPQFAILSDRKYWIVPKGIEDNWFDNFLSEVRRNHPYFLTGRGCPYRCIFCVEGNLNRKFRYRSAEKVKTDLEYFLSITGANYVAISDDTFTSSPKRVKEICRIFKEVQKKYPFVWFAEGRVDVLSKYPELIGIMKDAGLVRLQIGIESGNQEVLNIYNKGITLKQIEKVVIETSKYDNIILHGNLILGNPNESYMDFVKSLDFINHLFSLSKFKFDTSLSYLTPFEGTPIRINPEQFDIEILYDNFEFKRFGMMDVTCKPKLMSMNEVNSLQTVAELKLTKYLRDNMFSISKNDIQKRLRFRMESKVDSYSISWAKTFNSLYAFQRYEYLIEKKSTISSEIKINDYKELIPFRVWEIEYKPELAGYVFISLSGSKTILTNFELKLWELATGKNTINEIFKLINNIEYNLEKIYNYYIYLENNLAIVFKEF